MMHKLDIPRNHTTNLLSQGQPMSIVLSGPFAASIHRWTILTAEEDSRNQESNSPQTSDFLPEVTTAYLGLACNIIQEKNKFWETHCLHHLQVFESQSHDSSIFKPFRTFEGRKVKKHCFVKPLYTYQPTNQPTSQPTNQPQPKSKLGSYATMGQPTIPPSLQPCRWEATSSMSLATALAVATSTMAMGSFVEDTVLSTNVV